VHEKQHMSGKQQRSRQGFKAAKGLEQLTVLLTRACILQLHMSSALQELMFSVIQG
jgi:hypothetical protein